MAEAAGVIGRVTTHAIRRGALRDVAMLPADKLNVTNRAIVASVAGHNSRLFLKFLKGVTDRYAEEIEALFFNLRAEADREDKRAPIFLPYLIPQKKKVKTSSINQYMEANEMDLNDTNQRQRAKRRLKQIRDEELSLESSRHRKASKEENMDAAEDYEPSSSAESDVDYGDAAFDEGVSLT
jgi:hypothetical protein